MPAKIEPLSLRDAAEAALTDFIYEHGSDFTPELWPGMTALRATLAVMPPDTGAACPFCDGAGFVGKEDNQ